MAVIRFGQFELDTISCELRERGSLVDLQRQPARVLALLAQNSGQLLTRDEIRKCIWGEGTFVDFDQGLNYCIRQIRAALAEDPDRPEFIETLPRRGYRFIADVEEISETQRGKAQQVRLAVLAFEEHAGSADQNYFATAFTEEMVSTLSRLNRESLRVIVGNDSLRSGYQNWAQLQRKHKLDFLLRGTIERRDALVKFFIQIVSAYDSGVVWTGTFESSLFDPFKLPEEAAQQIAQAVAVNLIGPALNRPSTYLPSAKAREAYLKGRYFWHKMTVDSISRSMKYFNEALESDPKYAAPYAGLADCYIQLASVRLTQMKPVDAIPLARPLVQKALELDASLPEAHCTNALIHIWYERDWAAAEREFQSALTVEPDNVTALVWNALFQSVIAQPAKAFTSIRRARDLDPWSPMVNAYFGAVYYNTGHYELALDQLRSAVEMDPHYHRSHLFLGIAHCYLDQLQEAEKCFLTALEINPGGLEAISFLACCAATIGNRRNALKYMREVKASEARWEPALLLAMIHSCLEEIDEAFDCLARAFEQNASSLYLVRMDPRFRNLHDDPRFIAYLKSTKLPPFTTFSQRAALAKNS